MIGDYHPFAACLMYKGCHDEEVVHANLADATQGWEKLESEHNKEYIVMRPCGAHIPETDEPTTLEKAKSQAKAACKYGGKPFAVYKLIDTANVAEATWEEF